MLNYLTEGLKGKIKMYEKFPELNNSLQKKEIIETAITKIIAKKYPESYCWTTWMAALSYANLYCMNLYGWLSEDYEDCVLALFSAAGTMASLCFLLAD